MAERSSRNRLSSTVVVPRSNRRDRRERSRSPINHSESRKNRRNIREYNQHDDRCDPHSERTSIDTSTNENRPRRSWQNEQVAVRERLGFVRDRERQPRMTEVNTDPRDVPRGKRYFEHDDRESGNQKFNTNNRRRSFPRQRSLSPVWKHDHFDQEERRSRTQRPRQSSWRQRNRSPAWKHDKFSELENVEKQQRPRQSSWRQRDQSPAWKHDKFEELENIEKQEEKSEKDKPRKRRESS